MCWRANGALISQQPLVAFACVCAGPGAAQQLVDTNKGYAVLLKKGKEPITAALMDVYGKVRRTARRKAR